MSIINSTRVYWAVSIGLVVLSAAAAGWLASSLPDQIPTHWNIHNEVDGYGGKWTLYLMPVMMAGHARVLLFLAGVIAQIVRGGCVPAHVSASSWCSSSGCSASCRRFCCTRCTRPFMGQCPTRSGFFRGAIRLLRSNGQGAGQGAQELLHRYPRAVDPGQ